MPAQAGGAPEQAAIVHRMYPALVRLCTLGELGRQDALVNRYRLMPFEPREAACAARRRGHRGPDAPLIEIAHQIAEILP